MEISILSDYKFLSRSDSDGRNNEANSFYETDPAELGNDTTRPQTSLGPHCSNKVTASDCAHPVSIVTSQRTVHGHGGFTMWVSDVHWKLRSTSKKK